MNPVRIGREPAISFGCIDLDVRSRVCASGKVSLLPAIAGLSSLGITSAARAGLHTSCSGRWMVSRHRRFEGPRAVLGRCGSGARQTRGVVASSTDDGRFSCVRSVRLAHDKSTLRGGKRVGTFLVCVVTRGGGLRGSQ